MLLRSFSKFTIVQNLISTEGHPIKRTWIWYQPKDNLSKEQVRKPKPTSL